MRKIIDHQNSANFALHVHAPLHAAERRQGFRNLLGADSPPVRNRHCCHSIQGIVLARRGQRKITKQRPSMLHAKAHPFAFHSKFFGHPVISVAESVGFDRAVSLLRGAPERRPRLLRGDPIVLSREAIRLDGTKRFGSGAAQGRAGVGRIAPNNHAAAPRDEINQASKRQLIGLEIRIDVRVIKLERCDD